MVEMHKIINTLSMSTNQYLPSPVFAEHGFLTPESPRRPFQVEMIGGGGNSSGGGFPILPLLLAAGLVTGLIFVRSKKKGISKKQYLQNKVHQAKEFLNSLSENPKASEQVKNAVEEFKASNPDKAANVSFTQSCLKDGFVAIKNMEGQLLAEIPISK